MFGAQYPPSKCEQNNKFHLNFINDEIFPKQIDTI